MNSTKFALLWRRSVSFGDDLTKAAVSELTLQSQLFYLTRNVLKSIAKKGEE